MKTLPSHYSKLPGAQLLIVGPSSVQCMMTGVRLASQDRDGNVRLVYTDETAELAHCPEINLGDADKEGFNFFSVVSAVQSKRAKDDESVDGPSAGQCDDILGKSHYNS